MNSISIMVLEPTRRGTSPVSAHCMLTGARPGFGRRISHSHRRTSRRFDPNIQSRRYWLPSESRRVRLRLSTKGIKTVDTIGVEAAVARIRARGVRI
ncbi:large subunit ribosomal protein L28 [Streptomyces rishiriensis]|uniref:Large ribosomal subunit protein bL28 n=1 Tax=Streptomyces rishiriensis TaxID=68264 RepID=A0ABU0NTW1_STRRH|nr:large subunit ribosomal protein L28 [Streptomyces rishiriensis]